MPIRSTDFLDSEPPSYGLRYQWYVKNFQDSMSLRHTHDRLYCFHLMASTSKKRKWNETYQQYGFTKFSRDGLDAAQCIHCSTVLANCSLKPAKLSHHQSNLHPNIELTEERP
ncbi:Protein ZBED8 [Chionoecetes opilio]|uniref:Protein ZBED8 n=1 Tax=Chionoecetes opilio TaxID=41210 RepID=A0A8J4Y075_CHIOP|nr:Protein ZBED8 [Chionoecetes opilio]